MEWRLDKFLTQIPVGTRSQVKDMIKKGRVCVNGVHASKPELKVDPENDSITLDGKKLFLFSVCILYVKQAGWRNYSNHG